jgi:hypothetical protein
MPVTFVSFGGRPWQAAPPNTYDMFNEDTYIPGEQSQYWLDIEDDEVYRLGTGDISGKTTGVGGTEDHRDTWIFAYGDEGLLDDVDLTFKLNFSSQFTPLDRYNLKLEYMPFGASEFNEVGSIMTRSRPPGDERPEAILQKDADPGFYKVTLENTDNISALGQHSYALDMLIS